MFQSEDLKAHLEQSASISVNSLVTAEWNMNIATNIAKVGNYRYRPTEANSPYSILPNNYDPLDAGTFYTNATYSDITIDGGLDVDDEPIAFKSIRNKEALYFSLEDCLYNFRPRSGINKLRYLDERYTHHSNIDLARRPRYYMADKQDKFKYWTSYRTETDTEDLGSPIFMYSTVPIVGSIPNVIERGIASNNVSGRYHIDDAVPFVVYKNPVPANRLVVKMQTHVGDIDLGPFKTASENFADPFFGFANQQTPRSWKIQYLVGNSWIDAISFNDSSTRSDGTPIVGPDGYVELVYGLLLPEEYRDKFKYFGELISESALPEQNIDGAGYLIKLDINDIGYYKIYNIATGEYSDAIIPNYGWRLFNESLDSATPFVTDLTSPASYYDDTIKSTRYREFEYISGIRIVVQTMNKLNSTFDLIEFSPRLVVDLSDKITEFSVTKSASDLGSTGLPIGQLLAATGSLSIFDYDRAFSSVNENSVISQYLSNHIQFKFYEIVLNVDGFDYYVPIKTMYSEGFPEVDINTRDVAIETRDLYFYFESLEAPQIFVQNASLSYAVALLLDSIGFSNYTFFRLSDENEIIIPNFFVAPNTTIASVLSELAASTQSAMFFDEYNNFVIMSKNYMMASADKRETDIELRSTKDFEKDGIVLNSKTSNNLANIINIASTETSVYNSGQVGYTSRYIQRAYGGLSQSLVADRDKTWVYRPVPLWEATGTEITKSINNEGGNASSYTLSAIPLASDLSDVVPNVVNNVVINNVMNLGEGVYFISRYSGYFYANGEIIKYDAVEFAISGPELRDDNGNITSTIWIKSQKEYENIFSKLAFNGKIFPTGRVRIYSEPNYETVNGETRLSSGAVAKHGRGQFGTPVVYHSAGLNQYWSDTNNCKVFKLPEFQEMIKELNIRTDSAREADNNAKAIIGGIVKNFLSKSSITEAEALKLYSLQTGTTQSSALIMQGAAEKAIPARDDDEESIGPLNYVSYVYKELDSSYRNFGTRMRIIGKIENNDFRGQTPSGSTTYYNTTETTDPSKLVSISGGSGGIGIFINPENHAGYYFEIVALNANNTSEFANSDKIYNILFWKTSKQKQSGPRRNRRRHDGSYLLFGGYTAINVDDGQYSGQARVAGQDSLSVYDIAVEYEDKGDSKTFYLYINNQIIAIVEDKEPLPVSNTMALFVRGSSRIMFENLYALGANSSENASPDTPVNSVFGNQPISINEAFRKYSISGMIQSTYLSGISSGSGPAYKIYFDEFGTIMREAAYFDIEYDKAYPALYAKLTPTFNRINSYAVSGFRASSYGAEFLIFNTTDTILPLDNKNGTGLQIQGVTFTQASENKITVDDYFDKLSDFSNPEFYEDNTVRSPLVSKEIYNDIRNSRIIHGVNEFTIAGAYIQDYDTALDIMEWTIPKISRPRLSMGLEVFGMPIIQLGDIISISYDDADGNPQVSKDEARFVVYHIEYSYQFGGPSTIIYVSEIV